MLSDLPQILSENDKEVKDNEFADMLFSKLPQPMGSIGFMAVNGDNVEDPDETTFTFELLLNIFMKGTIDGARLFEMLSKGIDIEKTDDVQFVDVYNVGIEQLEVTKRWFQSIGYMLKIHEYEEPYKIQSGDYCKIYLKDNPHNKPFFYMRQLYGLYHFVLQSTYEKTTKLENIRALFYKPKNLNDPNSKNKIYTIGFEKILTGCHN